MFCNQGWVVQKPVDANQGLKVNRRINFSCIQMFFTALVVIIPTQNRRPNNTQNTSPQSYKTQLKILAYPGLADLINRVAINAQVQFFGKASPWEAGKKYRKF